jgi:copper chaperone CopZ
MIHSYNIAGITCNNCVVKVKSSLLKLPDVISADVAQGKVIIEMSKHISTAELQQAISPERKYIISDEAHHDHRAAMPENKTKGFFEIYKPLFLIFIFISGISLLTSSVDGNFNGIIFMNHFMAAFFLTFSFFKFLDLKGFSESYAMYDVLAMKLKAYGFSFIANTSYIA